MLSFERIIFIGFTSAEFPVCSLAPWKFYDLYQKSFIHILFHRRHTPTAYQNTLYNHGFSFLRAVGSTISSVDSSFPIHFCVSPAPMYLGRRHHLFHCWWISSFQYPHFHGQLCHLTSSYFWFPEYIYIRKAPFY